MGIAATAAAKDLAHTISFGVTLALITNMAQYTLHKCFTRRGSHWNRFGPFYLCALGVPFIMADLTRHVLQGEPNSSSHPRLTHNYSVSIILV
jgi:hypothetical protein